MKLIPKTFLLTLRMIKKINTNFKAIIFIAILFFLNNCSCHNNTNTSIKTNNIVSSQKNPKKNKTSKNNKKLKYKTGVRSILEDSKGDFWIGSHQEGVCLYDGKSFQYFTIEDGLNDNQVRSIQEDKKGQIWFGTAKGVNSYNGEEIISYSPNNTQTDLSTQDEWEKTDHDLWFNAGNQSGVYRYDGKELNYLPFPIPENNESFNPYGVTGFSKGNNGKIWISTYSAVFGYDGYSFEIIDDKKLGFKEEWNLLHVRSILEDSKGRLWIGNNGIGVLLNDGNTTINFSKKNEMDFPNMSNEESPKIANKLKHVFAIEEDNEGNIWFGDRDTGTWKYDGKTLTNYNREDGLTSIFVQVIYKDKKGELWFGLSNGDIFQFNGESFEKMF